MKYYRQGGLDNRNLFLTVPEAWKSKIKVSAGLVSPEDSPLGVWVATFSLCSPMAFPLCAHILAVSSSYKDTSPVGLGPHPMDSFNLNYLLKGPISKHIHIGG